MNNLKFYITLISLTLITISTHAQTRIFPQKACINCDTPDSEPDTSAVLEIQSTSKGILIPRMTSAERLAIYLPAQSLLVYDLTTNSYWYNKTALTHDWEEMNFSGGGIPSEIEDTDKDTKVQTEKFFDEDVIRFDLGGFENWRMVNGRLEQHATSGSLFIGRGSGLASFGPRITAVGDSALHQNTFGGVNTAIGSKALYINTSGNGNTATGVEALYSNTTGNENTAMGVFSLRSNTGSGNTAFGGSTLYSNTFSSGNTAVGLKTMYDNTTGNFNTAVGNLTLENNTTGDNNSAFGSYALFSNTTGYSNVAIGMRALQNNTTVSNLVAVGDSSLYHNGTGATSSSHAIWNTAIGSKTLLENTTGTANTAIGFRAMDSNTTGLINTANGFATLSSNTTGIRNTATGAQAMLLNTTGSWNTADGNLALYANTSGSSNVAIGVSSLYNNTTVSNLVAVGDSSLYSNTTGIKNTAIGSKSLFANTSGDNNTALGNAALNSNTTGQSNTGIGSQSLNATTTGQRNVAVGMEAGENNQTGNENTFIGHQAGKSLPTLGESMTGNVFIGHQAGANETSSDRLFIDNSSTSSPLLYGEFDNNLLRVNGTLDVNNAFQFPTVDGTSGQYLATDGSGSVSWTTPSGSSVLEDNDGDTKIQVEETTDEDIIRFDIAGSEVWRMKGFVIEPNITNVFIGNGAGATDPFALNTTAVGDSALTNNLALGFDGHDNSAFGSKSLTNNFDGELNTATGSHALYSNIFGKFNTATGAYSLWKNQGIDNSAFGTRSLTFNTTGSRNTAVGSHTLLLNDSGYSNTAIGHQSMNNNSTGFSNVALGNNTLQTNTIGDSIVCIGAYSDVSMNNFSNAAAFGAGAISNASGKVRLGNTNITVLEAQVALTVTSDKRFKYDVEENVPGLEFINKLRPVTYHFDTKAYNAHILPDGRELPPSKNNNILHTGFIAQEVETAATEIGYDFHGVSKPTNPKDNYGLRYAEFTVPLVKAVQEISSNEEKLEKEVEDLKSTLSEVQNLSAKLANENELLQEQLLNFSEQMDDMKIMITQLQGCCIEKTQSPIQSSTIELTSPHNAKKPYLKQNTPNPFYQETIIEYFLPENFQKAEMRFTDWQGRNLKTIPLQNTGHGTISISAKELAAGTYAYTLIMDGKIVDTKKMILTKF